MNFTKCADQINDYDKEGFVYFTFPRITTHLNKDGIEKKKPENMPNWKTVNKDNYKTYFSRNHTVLALLTGKMSGLTVLDFDDKNEYFRMIEQYPELSKYKTIKTRNGFHIYFKYNENVRTTTNGMNNFKSVDIRNDDAIIFAPPTYYNCIDKSVAKYEDMGGDILDVPDYIFNDLKQNEKETIKEKTIKTIAIEEAETDDEKSIVEDKIHDIDDLKKLCQIINPKRFADYKEFISFMICVKNAFGEEGKPIWDDVCSKSAGYNKNDNNAKWDKYNGTDKRLNIGTLHFWAKHDDETKYRELFYKENLYISANDLDDPYNVALIVMKTLKHKLILCKEKWFMLSENNLWKQQKEPSFYIVQELRRYLDYSNKLVVLKISQTEGEEKDKLIAISKMYLSAYKSFSFSFFLSTITKYLRTLLADANFENKLDANAGKLAFKNGIVDLQTRIFRRGILSSDFITDTIPYDYNENIDIVKKAELKGIFKKILNNNDDHLEYFLSIVGFSLIGKPNLEKSLYCCVDKTDKAKGDNGKTFGFDIITYLMPNYVYKSKGSLLEEGNSKVHKQLAMMKGKRLVWLDEFGKKRSNAELMKELADGLSTENEVMFGTSENINVLFKLFILTNNMPVIDAKDSAVFNRYKQISYSSHFDRTGKRTVEDPENLLFIADTTLGDKIKRDYANEVFALVIEYANKYYTDKLPNIPAEFIKGANETQLNNDPFGLWFNDNIIIDADEKVALKIIIKNSGLSEKLVKEGMIRMGFKYNKELKGIGKDEDGKYYKGGYIGCKETEEENKEDEDKE